MKSGIHKAGASLAGVFGRRAATVSGYHYSKDLKAAGAYGLVWDRQSIDGFLQDPSRFLKAYLGQRRRARSKIKYRDHQFRHNIAAYLKRETFRAGGRR
jgi:cytochrome c